MSVSEVSTRTTWRNWEPGSEPFRKLNIKQSADFMELTVWEFRRFMNQIPFEERRDSLTNRPIGRRYDPADLKKFREDNFPMVQPPEATP